MAISSASVARFLRDDPGCQYDLFLDLCGVDNLRRHEQRRQRIDQQYKASRRRR